MTPTVSVIMAVHNGEPYLADSIDSILGQSFEDFEFLIVDDASTDATAAILADYAARDPRIRVLSPNTRLGFTAALNVAVDEVRGDVIARHDADDLSHPDRLQRQLAALREDDQLGLLGTSYHVIDSEGRHLKSEELHTSDAALRWLSLFHNPFCHTSVMVRRALVERAGGYDETLPFSQDFDLWTRIMAYTRVANLADPLVSWRTHPTSISSSRRVEQQQISDAIAARQMAALLEVESVSIRDAHVLRKLVHGLREGVDRERETAALALLRRLFAAFQTSALTSDSDHLSLPGMSLLAPPTHQSRFHAFLRRAGRALTRST